MELFILRLFLNSLEIETQAFLYRGGLGFQTPPLIPSCELFPVKSSMDQKRCKGKRYFQLTFAKSNFRFQPNADLYDMSALEFSIPESKHGDEEHAHKDNEQHPHHDDGPAGAAKGGVFGDIGIDRRPAMRAIG